MHNLDSVLNLDASPGGKQEPPGDVLRTIMLCYKLVEMIVVLVLI